MSTLSIQLDAEALTAATAQAISGVLSPEIQKQLIEKAIKDLLKPEVGYTSKQSKIEEIFQRAVYKIAHDKALEMVEKDQEVQKSLAMLMEQAFKHMISPHDPDKMKALAQKLGDSFIDSLSSR